MVKTRSGKKLINDVVYVKSRNVGKQKTDKTKTDKPKVDKPKADKGNVITLNKTKYALAKRFYPVDPKPIKVRVNRNGGEGRFLLRWIGTDPETGLPWVPTWEPYSNLCQKMQALYERSGKKKELFEFNPKNYSNVDEIFHYLKKNWGPRFEEFKFVYKLWKSSSYDSSSQCYYEGEMKQFIDATKQYLMRSVLARQMGGSYLIFCDKDENPIEYIFSYEGPCKVYFNAKLLVRHMHRFVRIENVQKEYEIIAKHYSLSDWKMDMFGKFKEINDE